MTVYFARGLGAAVFCISTAPMAFADVTAQDVWSDWKSYLTGAGYEVSGTESTSGGTLTISGLTMSMQMPQTAGAVSVDLGQMVLAGNSDGTVSVSMPATIPMRIFSQVEGEDSFDVGLSYTQSGHSLVVSGDPDNMNTAYKAAQVDMTLSSLVVDGEQMPPGLARVSVTLTDVISDTLMQTGDMRSYSQTGGAETLSYDFAFNDPESDDAGEFTGTMQGVGFEGAGKIPGKYDTADFAAMLKAGFAFDGAFTYSASNTEMQGVGDGEKVSMTSSSQGGRLGVAMSAAHLAYDVSQMASAISITTSQLPFPVAINMAEVGFKLDIPVAKSDEEQDFAFSLKLADFTISDMIWGMFDPGAVLPPDPATIALDLTGKAKVLVDFFDPAVAEQLEHMSAPPGELNALNINQLLVSAVGAKLSGTGQFTFDNTDLESFDGLPAPAGEANLELTGANGLIDKLIQMGLMSDQDAMGGRMMMGMMAVPGDGPDTLKSKIEINDQGHISANGQRLK
ncbi:MAG: hypothetical protein ACI8R4_000661 [Paracoccaceae bacterium]|jgi:hypothetical protein